MKAVVIFAELAGFVVLLPACLLHAWTEPLYPSIKPLKSPTYRDKVDRWKWGWLNAWYANTEDGVSGQQAWIYDAAGDLMPYVESFPSVWPKWAIAYAWSAWRNGANNLKRPLRQPKL